MIERDPTLTAKLLKTVNSASFGLRAQVKTVQQAVSILGLETLRATIIAIALGEYFVKGGFGKSLDVSAFCAHSLATAVIMREGAEALRLPEKDLLYLLGLLHDLDKLVLDFLAPEGYAPVLERIRKGGTLAEAEQAVFGVDGKTVWMETAGTWEFPGRVIELYRGTGEEKTRAVPALLRTASRMAEEMGYSFLPVGIENPEGEDTLLTELPEETVFHIGKAVRDQAESLSTILELPPPNPEEVQHTFLKTTRKLSLVNAELELRIDMLGRLTRASMSVIRSLDKESVTLPVLQGLAAAFQVKAAFLLQGTLKKGLAGLLLSPEGKGEARKVTVPPIGIPAPFREALHKGTPLRVERADECPLIGSWFGKSERIWIVPIPVKGRFHALLGLAAGSEGGRLFGNDDLKDALRILGAELGLTFEVARLHRQLRIEAATDPLTRINNRGTILRILKAEFARFQRSGVPLCVAIFDMDRFKSLNDNLGHLAGDEFLVHASRTLKESVRESDYVGRYGGDEFVALFPDTGLQGAAQVVERVRTRLMEVCARFCAPEKGVKLSVSVGLACARPGMNESKDLLRRADDALYEAKEGGRDRCVVAVDGRD